MRIDYVGFGCPKQWLLTGPVLLFAHVSAQVSCIAFTPGQCDPFISPELKADSGVLEGTKITGWCP